MNKFEQKFRVELSDITPSFGLKATSVLKYYQETFARYCAKYNVAGYDVYQMGLKWVLGQTIVEFADIIPIWNEEVTAKVYICNVKKLRMYLNFEILTDRGLVAKGQSVAYILDLQTSRPQPILDIINHFELDENQFDGEIIKMSFVDDGEIISNNEHSITFSDIDYNNHTNNISYVSFALEGLDTDYIQNNYPKILDIKYLQETFLNDNLKCTVQKKDNTFLHTIINAKDNSTVCIVHSIWQQNNMKPETFFELLNIIRIQNS